MTPTNDGHSILKVQHPLFMYVSANMYCVVTLKMAKQSWNLYPMYYSN
jgi:hypothetical protein